MGGHVNAQNQIWAVTLVKIIAKNVQIVILVNRAKNIKFYDSGMPNALSLTSNFTLPRRLNVAKLFSQSWEITFLISGDGLKIYHY